MMKELHPTPAAASSSSRSISYGARRSLLLAGLSFSALLAIMTPITVNHGLHIAFNHAWADSEGDGNSGDGGEGDGDNNDSNDGDHGDDNGDNGDDDGDNNDDDGDNNDDDGDNGDDDGDNNDGDDTADDVPPPVTTGQ